MKDTDILKIDSRGRIVIPRSMRRTLGLKENSYIMIIAEEDKGELRIVPLPFTENQAFLRVRVVIPDEVGALSRISGVFAKYGLSLLYGQTIVIKRGVDSEWSVLSPVPEIPIEEFKKILMEEGGAKKVYIEKPPVSKSDEQHQAF